jgi:diaminopimelate epimerase
LISFTKAHACGNDFLIVTEEAAGGRDRAEMTRRLCARNTGVGADGIEFFAWTGPRSGRIRLHNADGSIAEISGNGTRCVAAWMAEKLGARPGDLLVTIPDGVRVAGVEVSTGNPHFVIVVDNPQFTVDGQRWQSIGQQICAHPDFPYQTNVEFVQIVDTNQIEIRIFERGVGPTSSSGTGTSASATAVLALSGCASPLRIVAPGGAQTVTWDGPGTQLNLTGPASLIARGEAWDG